MRAKQLMIMFAVPAIAGCTQQQVYEQVRHNRLDACERNHAAAVEECQRDYAMTYEDYRRSLRGLDEER